MAIERTYYEAQRILQANFELDRVKQFIPASDHAITALLGGDASCAVRGGVFRVGDTSAGSPPVAGAGGDGCFAPASVAAGALAATSVLPRWIRVIAARLERVIGGGDAATAAYEPSGNPSAASGLRFFIVEESAALATRVFLLRVRIETCKFSTCTKTWVLFGPRPE